MRRQDKPHDVWFDFNRPYIDASNVAAAMRAIDSANARGKGPILFPLLDSDVDIAMQIARVRNDRKQARGYDRPYQSGQSLDDNFIAVLGEAFAARLLYDDDGFSHVDCSERIEGDDGIDFWWHDVPITVKTTRDELLLYLDANAEKKLRAHPRTDIALVQTHALGYRDRTHPKRPRMRAYVEVCSWMWIGGFWKRATPHVFAPRGDYDARTQAQRTVLALDCWQCRDIRTLKPTLNLWQKKLEREGR